MDIEGVKQNRYRMPDKLWSTTQITLRFVAFITSFASVVIIYKNREVNIVYGIEFTAYYTDDPTFRFFEYANTIAACISAISLIFCIVISLKTVDKTVYFYFFIHDLILETLIIAACASASAIGYVGKYGNLHAGWGAICDYVSNYCDNNIVAVSLSYFCFFIYLFLTVMSANKSRQSQY